MLHNGYRYHNATPSFYRCNFVDVPIATKYRRT